MVVQSSRFSVYDFFTNFDKNSKFIIRVIVNEQLYILSFFVLTAWSWTTDFH